MLSTSATKPQTEASTSVDKSKRLNNSLQLTEGCAAIESPKIILQEKETLNTIVGKMNESSASQSVEESKILINCLMNIGSTYYLQESCKEAIDSFNEALEIASQYSDFTKQKMKCLHHIAAIQAYLEQSGLALENYERALAISQEYGYHLDACIQLCKIGQLQLKEGVYREALEYFGQCLEVVEKYSFESQRMDCLKGMYECCEILEDYTKANYFLKLIIQTQYRYDLAMGRVL